MVSHSHGFHLFHTFCMFPCGFHHSTKADEATIFGQLFGDAMNWYSSSAGVCASFDCVDSEMGEKATAVDAAAAKNAAMKRWWWMLCLIFIIYILHNIMHEAIAAQQEVTSVLGLIWMYWRIGWRIWLLLVAVVIDGPHPGWLIVVYNIINCCYCNPK